MQVIDLLNQAVARDPSFFDAYGLLVSAHDNLYAWGLDHTPARLGFAKAALQAASHLRPDDGATHFWRAHNLYMGYLDYDGALRELEIARRKSPNDNYVFELMGFVQRRQGRWKESTRNLERAIELDPRNANTLYQLGLSYGAFRRYAEQKSNFDRILAIEPNHLAVKAERAFVEVNWKANTGPLRQLIE